MLGRPEITIARPLPDDLEAVHALLAAIEYDVGSDPGGLDRHDTARLLVLVDAEPALLAMQTARAADGSHVGYAIVEMERRIDLPAGLLRLAVAGPYRRHGIGRRLTMAALEAAARQGAPELWLTVAPDNAPARHLYRSLGFAEAAACPVARWSVPGERIMHRPTARP